MTESIAVENIRDDAPGAVTAADEIVLKVDDLSIGYQTESGYIKAVRHVSLAIRRQESFGLVGESGSGKSTLALGAIRYLAANGRIDGGAINFMGQDITGADRKEMSKIWGRRIGMVYQNPSLAMNPSIRIGRQLAEVAELHQKMTAAQAERHALKMLDTVSMPDPKNVSRLYPHQLSGGMLQRCIIAMALSNQPDLLVMDEPTTALDVTTQAVVLDLVERLKDEFRSAIFYITHDLAVVAKICDTIGVMYAGELLESGPARDIFKDPKHPYTLSLLGSIPQFEEHNRKKSLTGIPGLIPRLWELPPGCIFSPRCFMAAPECLKNETRLSAVNDRHWSACLRWAEMEAAKDRVTAAVKSYPGPEDNRPLIETKNLSKLFPALDAGIFSKNKAKGVKALNGVSIQAPKGATLGIVGESGCGKTTLMRAIIGLAPATAGEVDLEGRALPIDISKRPGETLQKIQMVFQNPDASLNPNQTIAQCLGRPLKIFGRYTDEERKAKVLALLDAVNLPRSYYSRLPGELSGGEQQRVGIARAFAADPEVILLDEPLSALDVSVQAALVNLLFELQADKQPTYLFISHDLAAVHHISDWVAVMYLGRAVETGLADEVFTPPFHPYTEALLSAIPVPDPDAAQDNIRLEGQVPSPAEVIVGCPFQGRCPRRLGSLCSTAEPPVRSYGKHGRMCCHWEPEALAKLQKNPYHALEGPERRA